MWLWLYCQRKAEHEARSVARSNWTHEPQGSGRLSTGVRTRRKWAIGPGGMLLFLAFPNVRLKNPTIRVEVIAEVQINRHGERGFLLWRGQRDLSKRNEGRKRPANIKIGT